MEGSTFDIVGRISSQKLSEKTHYSSYLVHILSPKHSYFNGSFSRRCRFVDNVGRVVGVVRGTDLYDVRAPVPRDEEWMEVEIGTFFNARGNRNDVESRVLNFTLHFSQSLIVRGLEFRPETVFGGMNDCGFFKEFLEEKSNF